MTEAVQPRIRPIAVRKALTITRLPFSVRPRDSGMTTTESQVPGFVVMDETGRSVTGSFPCRAYAEAIADERNGRWIRKRLEKLAEVHV